MKLTKTALVTAIATSTGFTQADAQKALDTALDEIQNTLAEGGEVALPGFGTFSVRERAARQGRNPQTGETIEIAASKAPAFKAGKPLKDACNP